MPLSRAICCRPCLPKHLPPELSSLHSNDNVSTAVAIVSIGCHKSAAVGAQQTAAALWNCCRFEASLLKYFPWAGYASD